MENEKKFYWMKLMEGYFDQKTSKYLRSLPNGDTLLIIYLKMQLLTLRTEGFIKYDQLLPSCEEELAMVLEEDVNDVRLCVKALEQSGAVERWSGDMLYIAALQPLIGSETAAAKRVRKHREQKKQLALQCNTDVTKCNTEIEIEIEKEIDIDIDYEKILTLYSSICISFPRIKTLTQKRKDAIKERITENKYSYEDFETLFTMAEQSSFLKGHNKDKWSATFDWLIKEDNMAKVLEGNYIDKPAPEPEEFKTNNPFLQMLREEGEI